MFVKSYLELSQPIQEVCGRLLEERPESWIPGIVEAEGEWQGELLAKVGIRTGRRGRDEALRTVRRTHLGERVRRSPTCLLGLRNMCALGRPLYCSSIGSESAGLNDTGPDDLGANRRTHRTARAMFAGLASRPAPLATVALGRLGCIVRFHRRGSKP
jgi:hypothetical protein